MASRQRPQVVDEVVIVREVLEVDGGVVAKDLTTQTSIDLVPILFVQMLTSGVAVQGSELYTHAFLTQQQGNTS